MLDLSRTAWRPPVGDVVRVVPNHVCIVVHLNDRLVGSGVRPWNRSGRGVGARALVLLDTGGLQLLRAPDPEPSTCDT